MKQKTQESRSKNSNKKPKGSFGTEQSPKGMHEGKIDPLVTSEGRLLHNPVGIDNMHILCQDFLGVGSASKGKVAESTDVLEDDSPRHMRFVECVLEGGVTENRDLAVMPGGTRKAFLSHYKVELTEGTTKEDFARFLNELGIDDMPKLSDLTYVMLLRAQEAGLVELRYEHDILPI
ncbi:hypothetical protein KKE92_04775 [Candidatus Micrarchaeota archaeon]|nr:hypothetical protein [Candidatus Micrarchaeota archaeon]